MIQKKKEEFKNETDYIPIKNGKFTCEYKAWLTWKQYKKKIIPQPQSKEEEKILYCKYCGIKNFKLAKNCEFCGSYIV